MLDLAAVHSGDVMYSKDLNTQSVHACGHTHPPSEGAGEGPLGGLPGRRRVY